MVGTEISETGQFLLVARRNNSLTPAGRQVAFASILLISLVFSLAFALHGAWPVMPFWGLEMAGLWLAFRHVERHAQDFERVSIDGDRVLIERQDTGRRTRFEFNRAWAQLVAYPPRPGHRATLALRSHGRQVEFGRLLTDEQRVALARTLRRELAG